MPQAGQNLPGRLRISWDTLQRVGADARLTGSTAIVTAELSELDEVEREGEVSEEEAPEPVFGIPIAGAAEPGGAASDGSGQVGAAEAISDAVRRMPWFAWAAIGLGIIGVVAAGWLLYTRKIAPRKVRNAGSDK